MFKVNNETCLRPSGPFIVNFEHIPHFFFSVAIADFEKLNFNWEQSNEKHQSKAPIYVPSTFLIGFEKLVINWKKKYKTTSLFETKY